MSRNWKFTSATFAALMLFSAPSFSCCSTRPARFSATTGLAAEAIKNKKIVHLLGYQNTPTNESKEPGGNAMFLPIPAKPGSMGKENIFNTSKTPHLLKNMKDSLDNYMEGQSRPRSFSKGEFMKSVQVFDSGIYTIVLAANAKDIPAALERVPAAKRPPLNPAIFDSYAKWYPGWTYALCCFNTKDASTATPMLWWYEPMDESKLFFPALDAHTGKPPDLKAVVDVDHTLIFSVPQLTPRNGHLVSYSDPIPTEMKALLPVNVLGTTYNGTMAQGDFSVDVNLLRKGNCQISRILPPGNDDKQMVSAAKIVGLADKLYKPTSSSSTK